MDFSTKYESYLKIFNESLQEYCNGLNCKPQILCDSLKYSLLLGGKRIRPVLAYATADLLGIPHKKIKNFALAIELIHTYSLIHDDLPAMDNDDFRRGKPSNHKAFGEANAILAGDGLLNAAYSVLFDECFNGLEYVTAAKFICDSAGVYGMIAGQSADILYSEKDGTDERELSFIYENKTAKLITAPIMAACILSGGKEYSKLKQFGLSLGILFQLTDDILDVEGTFENLGKSIGKDEKEKKLTAIKIYGLDACKVKCELICDDCCKLLEGIDGDTSFLNDFVHYVVNRIG